MTTWEETIKHIRTLPEYTDLVENAYLSEHLQSNVERFFSSDELKKTIQIIKKYKPSARNLLDIGCGNGISSIAFAKNGFNVSVVEPDPSITVGAGAVRILKDLFDLNNLTVSDCYAENLEFDDNSFDVVYARQSMHHANNLNKFLKECARVLRKSGLLLTIRDHVVFNEKDKKVFLETHPLQKYYGGENAFRPQEYKNAIKNAGLKLVKEIKYFDNIINYYPITKEYIEDEKIKIRKIRRDSLKIRIGFLSDIKPILDLYCKLKGPLLNENDFAGRMYSYIALKR